jgi:hypothetical protein
MILQDCRPVANGTLNDKLEYFYKIEICNQINLNPAEIIKRETLPLIIRIPKIARIPKISRRPTLTVNVTLEELMQDLIEIDYFITKTIKSQLEYALINNVFEDLEDHKSQARQHIIKRFIQGKFTPRDIIYKRDENGDFIIKADGTKRIDTRQWAKMVATNKIKHIRAFWSTQKRKGGLGKTTYTSHMLHDLDDHHNLSQCSEKSVKVNDEYEKLAKVNDEYLADRFFETDGKSQTNESYEICHHKFKFHMTDEIRKKFNEDIGFQIWKTLIEQPKEYIEFIENKIRNQEFKLKNGEIKRIVSKTIDPINLKWACEFFNLSRNKVLKFLRNFFTESGLYIEWDLAELFHS